MAEIVYKIPLSNVPQEFKVDFAGRNFIMSCVWFSAMGLWCITLKDSATETLLINNMPMVTGQNLLEQWEYLKIPGELVCYTAGDILTPPTLANLGVEAGLFYIVDPDAIEESLVFQDFIPVMV